jgi:DNA (cytosine-5)-methyltransferase 1
LIKNKLSEAPPYSLTDWRSKPFTNASTQLNIGTLFSGIGAVEHAFHRLNLNHNIIFAGDLDKFVKQSYFANYGHKLSQEDWHTDVNHFKAEKYKGQLDLLLGGSPCQSFSMVGKRGGFADTRGTLFHEFIRVVNETQPKVFIYENVKGLINHDSGNTWSVVKRTFSDLGYKFYPMILNARDYGIPQNRERVFVVGFLDHSVDFNIPQKIECALTMQDLLEDYIESKYFLKEKGVKFVTSEKNRLKRYTQINGNIALCQKANQQFNWHGDFIYDELVFDVREVEEKYYLSEKVKDYVLAGGTKNFKTSTDTDLSIARPLLQSMHKMHRAGVDNYVTHKGRIRKLTPRECLSLMGFDHSFKQVVSDTQMYRQAGNSIVVNVLMALLKEMDISRFGR